MKVYYNDVDSFCCSWIRELIKDGLLPNGDVDERSIAEVRPEDIRGYDQCHWFAGIGGWPLALQLANWGTPCWTGSPPCQPFSVAGRGEGFADERHLWPIWSRLIEECRPPVIFGEEVANVIQHGWLDLVLGDLERMSYACGALVFKASDVGAPHQRERLYWVADAGILGDADNGGQSTDRSGAVADAERKAAPENGEPWLSAFWSDARWIECRDGKLRPVASEPALFPVADGIPNRMGLLRGAGNAIVPQAGAAFVKAFMATR